MAGLSRGAASQRGKLFKHAATIAGALMNEYVRRVHDAAVNGSPCGWIFETAPMARTDGAGGAVRRLKEAYAAALGKKMWDDDGQKGGTSRRLTEMYTNDQPGGRGRLGDHQPEGTASASHTYPRPLAVWSAMWFCAPARCICRSHCEHHPS